MSRIIFPETFAEQQALLKNVLAKNASLGTKSPLSPLLKKQNLDVAILQASLGAAAAQNTDSGDLKKQSEMDTQHRNLALVVPWTNFLGEVQFLKSLNAGMERDLGEWGITIDAQNRVVCCQPAWRRR